MTITVENNNDVIVYALEKVISYARRTQQIFVAQCVWWLASIIGLESGLMNYIDNIQKREEVLRQAPLNEEGQAIPDQAPPLQQDHSDRVSRTSRDRSVSATPRDLTEDQRLDNILVSAEEAVQESFRDRTNYKREKTLKGTRTGPIRTMPGSRKLSKDLTEGINETEIQRRKAAGECLHCAWPAYRKGAHRAADCRHPIKSTRGTVTLPEKRNHQEVKLLLHKLFDIKDNSEEDSHHNPRTT